jgi:glycosyltransferase involved in cell wall biosynthesis
MASLPYFIFSPSTILSMSGLLRGPDTTKPTPAEDWREAIVDVVIPALNEADNIVLCLSSVLRQTLRPRRILLIDDGSSDRTIERAKAFCAYHGVEITAIRRRAPIGKTPTIKRQSRELDSDVEFILDADTVLESDNYIERTVQELYQAVGIASAFGTILPQRQKDRRRAEQTSDIVGFYEGHPDERPSERQSVWERFFRGATNLYRDVLYLFLQRFIYRGQVAFFGTTSNPVGCAVAYRRKYVRALFDYVGPVLGDDLTNSEDVFIGLAMLNEGYRNTQLTDVYARTVEPPLTRLHRQLYLWSSSFLQSCYYFDALLRSPFRALKRRRARRPPPKGVGIERPRRAEAPAAQRHVPVPGALLFASGPQVYGAFSTMAVLDPPAVDRIAGSGGNHSDSGSRDRRIVREPYRQAFGRGRTEEFGRPAGWILLMSAIEKVFFPTALLIMIILRNWYGLAATVVIESACCLTALFCVTKGQRLEYLVKGVAITPIRYALLGVDMFTIGKFASDLWITNNRKWRK